MLCVPSLFYHQLGRFGTITGADGAHLRIQLDEDEMSGNYHPIDGIEY